MNMNIFYIVQRAIDVVLRNAECKKKKLKRHESSTFRI